MSNEPENVVEKEVVKEKKSKKRKPPKVKSESVPVPEIVVEVETEEVLLPVSEKPLEDKYFASYMSGQEKINKTSGMVHCPNCHELLWVRAAGMRFTSVGRTGSGISPQSTSLPWEEKLDVYVCLGCGYKITKQGMKENAKRKDD